MGKTLRTLLFIFFSLIMSLKAFSTHLKAGEITSQRINGYQYKFIFTLFTDSLSFALTGIDEPTASLDFGDGTSTTVNRDAPGRVPVGNATFKNTYTFIHTFPGSGTYTVSYQNDNRNAGILNMNNSEYTPFYVESSVKISPFLGINNSPVLMYMPIDQGMVGQKFTHNPGAFDPEGDSISYEMGVPKQSKGIDVNGYADPNVKPVQGGTFTLNPITWDLVWDSPIQAGLYNVAIIIKEWRDGQVIGTIERDMQIKINPQDNHEPILKIPSDTCIIVNATGTILNATISATDPDGDAINLSATGGPFTYTNPKASFTASNPQPTPASGNFQWSLTCKLVREQPYEILFKAEDIHPSGTKLFDLQSWNIKILGPQPNGLVITNALKGFNLSWNSYDCSNASQMEIYRKDCDSSQIIVDSCEGGAPSGFKKVGIVPIGTTTFNDTTGLTPGSFYCYVIVAIFPSPSGGKSMPSEQSCIMANIGEPLPLNVSVIKTDTVNGQILIKWTQPFELDATAYPGPYKYVVLRSEGIGGSFFTPIDTLYNLADTTSVDSMINTAEKSYSYQVMFYYSGNIIKSTSVSSSSVFLSAAPGGNEAFLSWKYSDPWNNSGHYQRIYKETNGIFSLLDSVLVIGDQVFYTAKGLVNDDTVCFYVETEGEYCRPGLTHPLLNQSEMVCIIPRDTSKLCPPDLSDLPPCIDDGINEVTLRWSPVIVNGCNKDIKGYNVYYAEYEGDVLQLMVSNVPDTFFVDKDNFSLAGCYAVTSLDYYGKESAQSNKVCVDLCVYYELPNLITPNRDNHNDIFIPFPIPKNVMQVKFSVYNRWGEMVYGSDNNINLDWPGIDMQGNPLSSGVYFFEAEVTFKRRLHKKDQTKLIKGWIQVIQKDNGVSKE